MSNESKRVASHAPHRTEFESYRNQQRVGLIREWWAFLKHNKKWWLLPILMILFGFGTLIVLGGTAAGPFIYSLF